MNTHPLPEKSTPEDFPRDQSMGAVTGVHPKLLVRKLGDSYRSGLTEEELYVRYDVCFDLVNQLVDYCHRKTAERPEWSQHELLQKVRKAVASRVEWDFSPAEIEWMMKKLTSRMSWSSPNSPKDPG